MPNANITQFINDGNDPSPPSDIHLSGIVYDELHKIARSHRRRWSGNETLNTTSLIHEAYVKLAPRNSRFKNRTHFFATAAKIMRQVLVNYAERSNADKRRTPDVEFTDNDFHESHEAPIEELLYIDQLLKKIEDKNERHCRIAECRIFGGMSIVETAKTLNISPATVKREWALLSAWLYRELHQVDSDNSEHRDDYKRSVRSSIL